MSKINNKTLARNENLFIENINNNNPPSIEKYVKALENSITLPLHENTNFQ